MSTALEDDYHGMLFAERDRESQLDSSRDYRHRWRPLKLQRSSARPPQESEDERILDTI
ncbi:MAG: hypothetical protein JOZ13_02390 [Alphaproteobacteria bacterium]|nr:hypothetical protein [Alphaproteobacteria bacterium]